MPSPREVDAPVHGYREWVIRPGGGLYSFSAWPLAGRWPFDTPKRAYCWRQFLGVGPVHRAPGPGCTCGIYAWKAIPPQSYAPSGALAAWGVAELSGTVVVHTRGYRAELARPVALVYQPGAEKIAERYGLILLENLAEWSHPS